MSKRRILRSLRLQMLELARWRALASRMALLRQSLVSQKRMHNAGRVMSLQNGSIDSQAAVTLAMPAIG